MKILLCFLFLSQLSFGQVQTGVIQGTMLDAEDGDVPLPFVRVLVYSSGSNFKEPKGGVESDFDGNFRLNYVAAGKYDLVFAAESMGMDTIRMTDVVVEMDQITFLGEIEMKHKKRTGWDYIIQQPLIEMHDLDPFGCSTIIRKEDIKMH